MVRIAFAPPLLCLWWSFNTAAVQPVDEFAVFVEELAKLALRNGSSGRLVIESLREAKVSEQQMGRRFDKLLRIAAQWKDRVLKNICFYHAVKRGRYYVKLSLPRLMLGNLGVAGDSRYNFRNIYHLSAGALFPLGTDFHVRPTLLVTYSESLRPQAKTSALFLIKRVFGSRLNIRSYGDLAARKNNPLL